MLASLVLVPPAQGAQGTSVLGATTLPCTDELTRLMNQQLLRMTAYQFVDRVGVEVHARSSWTRGDPQYEKAHAIVAGAMAAEEKAGAPLYDFSTARMVDAVAATWSAAGAR